VALLHAIKLGDADKLAILRQLDDFRTWDSLDEKRLCLICSEIITGHDIQVIGGTRGAGPLRLICPTRLCQAIPMDWILLTQEILDRHRSTPAFPFGNVSRKIIQIFQVKYDAIYYIFIFI
jgi:hypothetical protein